MSNSGAERLNMYYVITKIYFNMHYFANFLCVVQSTLALETPVACSQQTVLPGIWETEVRDIEIFQVNIAVCYRKSLYDIFVNCNWVDTRWK
jgi:hypothetical protein